MNPKIDAVLSTVFSPDQPGGTVLAAKNGEIVCHKAFGKANLELDVDMKPEQVFKIASNTKPFTAVAILKLVEEGKLSLSDEVTTHLGDFETHGQSITIEHLLTQYYTDVNDPHPQSILFWADGFRLISHRRSRPSTGTTDPLDSYRSHV